MGKIKIVVSDQQPFMIDGIIGFLGHYPDLYEVVGGYKDLKTSHPAKLNRAIDSISNGYTYFDSVHMDCEKISSRYSSDNQLTNRESEILQLIADGKTNKEIANFLQLSRKTVETHRLNIMKKLDVHSGIELIKTALRMGVCTI